MIRLPSIKRLIARGWVRAALTFLLSLYIRLLWLTARVEWRIAPEAQPYVDAELQSLYCFWHGRLLFMPYFANSRRRAMNVLISQHQDGLLIAETVRWLGIRTIYGSSSKGSREALRGMMRVARAGENLAITPDGPRGPDQVAALGTAWIAKMTGLPVLPLTFSSSRGRHLRSWDSFLLPGLFSRVIMQAGPPIVVPRHADDSALERYRAEVESFMRRQTSEADALLTSASRRPGTPGA